jgi:NAD-dependent DNA ligase
LEFVITGKLETMPPSRSRGKNKGIGWAAKSDVTKKTNTWWWVQNRVRSLSVPETWEYKIITESEFLELLK